VPWAAPAAWKLFFPTVNLISEWPASGISSVDSNRPLTGAEHLKALAAVSRVVRHGPTLEKLRGARSRDAFAAVLMGADERDAA
jgi:hypothetical protein